ncbi:LacI family DNA-binding transcriptional regulator [Bradyrhizobium sp. GCM10027634]|uniref:LacI family DNA-binding transcriptional regulator n=1 Tax=unclassified Bradyrhizobium TaxID=2631580 RepID=UPI00263B7E81|nr:LacI family DNA-binding transcriptional regulator [Bradyrhizobium sp. WYCCWR 12677]MDN5001221.1 LacI family DNA-binding transcriptional regulator [Bradyrhizobium sp. WYCCWR 12677]
MRKNGGDSGREYEANAARVTIVDVARRAGVSKSTVSLVLGGSSLVAEATRERVTEVMAELGYIYHRGAATLRGAKSGVLGMVINDLSNPFYVELAIGIEQACQGAGFVPFIANSAEDPVRQQEVIRSMREHGSAGLVLAPAIDTSVGDVKRLVVGLPVVQVMRRLPGLKASLVAPENKEGARKATAHLIEQGHKRIAFVGGTTSLLVREERLSGYRLALEDAGIPLDASLVIETRTNYSGGGTAVPQLLNLRDPATAALCFNDVVAIGLIRALTQAGVAIGREFAVIGFDDIEEAKHMLPALTSVAVNARNLGSRAAQLLMRQIASGNVEPENILCPASLIIRSSCGTSASQGEMSS